MNPGEFNPGAGPGRAAPNAAMRMKPNMQVTQNDEVVNRVARILQGQGPFSGWQAEVSIRTRVLNVYQMMTSLRLIQPRIDLSNAAQAAMSFEHKAFTQAKEKNDYDKECTEKLQHIKNTRERQAAVAFQSGMMPQMAGGQNQIPGAFPQHINQNMQGPLTGSQMGMRMNGQNQQAAMQRQQQHPQPMQQQRSQPRPGNAVPLPDDISALSPQETAHVDQLANEIKNKTTPEDMKKIEQNLSNMTPEQRQYLANKKMEPMKYFFRSQALAQIRRNRRPPFETGRAPNAGVDANGNMMGDPMMNAQQQRQMQNMPNLQRQSAFTGNPGQSMEPPNFMGNVENIQGQQADGLRSQEAGHLVVPASSNQTQFPTNNHNNSMFSQQMGQNGPGHMSGNTINTQPQPLAQHHLQGGFKTAQERIQLQTAHARAQAAQTAQMAISGHGGQANPQTQPQLPGQSPVMPMLNQPMAPGQMSPSQMSPGQVPAAVRTPSRASNMAQHPSGLAGQTPMQGRPQIPQNLPQYIQEQLARMPPDQAQAVLMQQRRFALNGMSRANLGQQTQPGQGQSMMTNQMNNAMMRGSISGSQTPNPAGMPQGQQMTPQQRQQRQHEAMKLQLLRQQNNGVEMTPDQGKHMDRVSFPPSILNMNGTSMQVPNNVKSWGQLKQWAASNPQIASPNDVPRLMMLQKLHLGQLISASASQIKNQNSQDQRASPFQGTQAPFTNAQGFPGGQQPHPAQMAAMRPISAQDVQMARQKLGPQAANFTDQQIREILFRNRQKQMMQVAQNRAMLEGNMQTGQPPTQSLAPTVPTVSQAMSQPPQPQPQAPQPGTTPQAMHVRNQAAAAAKGAKTAISKQVPKKRPSTDDTAEARPTTTPQMTQPTSVPDTQSTAPPRAVPPFTPEQFARMNPQQRAQVGLQARKPQQQNRGQPLTRAAAEEAWNKNLPSEVLDVYNEIAKTAPPPKSIPVSLEQKAAMTKQLEEALDVLSRLDALVNWLAKRPGQEKNVKTLLAIRIQLMAQFKPSREWVVNDKFTIAADHLSGVITFMRKVFMFMIAHLQQQRPQPQQGPGPGPGPNAATTQANMPALNATNLQHLQAQEEALQQARRASSQSANAPAAPFAAPSPRGVPQYAAGGLAPGDLKLPPPKRRKQSHTGVTSSPLQANTAAPIAAAAKYNKAVADATSNAAALAGAFKCNVAECPNHYQGLPSQAALDKHIEENHQPVEEPIDDYLKYYHESLSIGLGLNPEDSTEAQPVASTRPAPSSARPSAIASPAKQAIVTPVIPNTMPMARVTSQLGAKTTSPAVSAQLLTPQLSSAGKAPKAVGKEKKQTIKFEPDDNETKDAWADCPTSLDTIHDTFSNFASKDLPCLGYESFEDFDISEATPVDDWVNLATLTPPDEADEAALLDKFFQPWDEESIARAAARMRIPPEIQVKNNGLMGQLEVDWDAVARYEKEGIPIPMC